MSSDGFNEIISEFNDLKQKKKKCKTIMDLCNLAQEDLDISFKLINKEVYEERLRLMEFLKTYNIVKELDFCTPAAFPLLYAFKLADLKGQWELSDEVSSEFKAGKYDPS